MLLVRFSLLILSLFAVLLGGLWLHAHLNTANTIRLRHTLEQEREALVNRLVDLTSEPLRVFVTDYSPWDEMVNFVSQPDPAWPRINIDPALETYRIDAVWIFRPDLTEVHGSVRDGAPAALRGFPLSPEVMRSLTAGGKEAHCFVQSDAGLLELRGAPIRPSDLQAVIPAPYGWLFAARRWDEAHLQQLATLLAGKIELTHSPYTSDDASMIVTSRPLLDASGKPIITLRALLSAPALQRAGTDRTVHLLILGGFGLSALLAFGFATHVWVVRPMRLLGASIQQRHAAPLASLLRSAGEFGALSRLMESSFQQEEKIRQIYTAFNAIDDAVFITDSADGRITYVNRGATRLLGLGAPQLLGRTLGELKAQPPGKAADGTWLRCHDGRLVEVEAREHALPSTSAQQMSVTVARDISNRRLLEKQRLHAQRLESLGTLAGGVAHDMNNMLTPIVLMLDEFQDFNQPPNPALLASVRSSVQRGAMILRQLLTFGQGLEGQRVPLNLKQLVEELRRIVASTFPKSITFQSEIARRLPTVVGDPTQIHQVLLNLSVNARDAMPEGGTITVSATYQPIDATNVHHWTGAKPGNYVRIEVADNGTGIPPEIIERIFDPFFTTKSPDRGTGLGLSTTLGIVAGHGGTIHVRSEPAHGTRFHILLPATGVCRTNSSSPTGTGEQTARLAGDDRTVLVVEDEEPIRTILVRMLGRMSFKVITASTGREGIELYHRHRAVISLVITDLNMPGLDGHAVLRALRADAPGLPILVMSGRIDEPVQASLRQVGISGVIDKPFGYAQIIEAVRAALK